MTEKQKELKIGIGNLEIERTILKPKKVNIVGVTIEQLSKAKKVVFMVKHPDKEETIKISSVSHLVDKSVKNVGTWLSLDKEGKLQKGTGLVSLLNSLNCNNIEETEGKEAETELDGDFLVFKAY